MIKQNLRNLLKPLLRIIPKRLLWRLSAQSIEYRFHKNDTWRQSPDFIAQTQELFTAWGYKAEDFAGELIIDLGAGSKLRSKFFKYARIIAIEPLADRFMQDIAWSDLRDAHKVYSTPAEEMHPELDNQVAFVMCINVLDHVFDYEQVMTNIYRMLKPGGQFLLSLDLHDEPSLTHPINFTKEKLTAALKKAGLEIHSTFEGLSMGQNYGEGIAWTVIAIKNYEMAVTAPG